MKVTLCVTVLCLAAQLSQGALLGETCGATNECSSAVENSVCNLESNVCECAPVSHVRDPDIQDRCFAVVNELLGPCEVDEQCTLDFTICNGEEGNFRCFCEEGYFANAAGEACVRRANAIQDPCEVNPQCAHILNAQCNLIFGQCRCWENFVPTDNRLQCLPRKFNLGDDCDISRQCSVDGSFCDIDRRCSCTDERVTYVGQCLPYIDNIQTGICVIDAHECPANSGCRPNGGSIMNCMCNEGYVKNLAQTACLPLRDRIGGICEVNEQCTVPQTSCTLDEGLRMCLCGAGLVANSDFTVCFTESPRLGDSCQISEQCTVDDAVCTDDVCVCRQNYIPMGNSRCLRRLGIEFGVCEINQQCPENSQCLEVNEIRMCRCNVGFVKNGAGNACLPERNTIGGVCLEDDQCTVNNAQCLDSDSGPRICTCPADHVTNSAFTICAPRATEIGSPCTIQDQCEVINGWCRGPFGASTCQCKPFTAANELNNYCLPENLDGPCQETADCAAWDNSVCTGAPNLRKCTCATNYVMNIAKDACLLQTNWGDCVEPQQCLIVNTDCLGDAGSQTCQCISDYVPITRNDFCARRAEKLRDPCIDSAQCRHLHIAALCNTVADECRCNSLYVESTDLTTCLRRANLGQECTESIQCTGTMRTECTDGSCSCISGYIANAAGNRCLEVATQIGDSCVENRQCPWVDSECSLSSGLQICDCVNGFVASITGQRCLRRATIIGNTCEESVQCTSNIPNTRCDSGFCRCNPFYDPSSENTECLKIPVDLGVECDDVTPEKLCEIAGASCVGDPAKTCECDAGYTPSSDNKACNQDKIEGVCEVEEQCLVGDSSCTGDDGSKTCTCDATFVPSIDKAQCLALATSTDGPCEESQQCLADSFCDEDESKCKCNESFVANSLMNKCLPVISDFDTICEETVQCTQGLPNTECADSGEGLKCLCVDGFVFNNALTECIKSAENIGHPCTAVDEHVCDAIEHSKCITGMCTCEDGFTSSLNAKRCLEERDALNTDCEESQQCTPSILNAECRAQKCSCLNTHVASMDMKTCLQNMDFNGTCVESQQCNALTEGMVECIADKCDCKTENHFAENRCWESRALGEDCSVKAECLLAEFPDRVECVESVCTCNVSYRPDTANNKCNSGVRNTIALLSLVFAVIAAKLM